MRFLRTSLIGLGIIAALPPLTHPANTLRFFTGSTDCSSGFLGSLADAPFDTLAIASGGVTHDETGAPVPNRFTARRQQAAAYWLIDYVESGHVMPTVWLLTGNGTQAEYQAERRYFQTWVSEFSGGTVTVPDDKIRIDSGINTSESAKHLGQAFSGGDDSRAVLFTDEFHARRLSMLACANGIPSRVISSEEVLVAHDPDRTAALRAWHNSPYMRYQTGREWKKRLTLLWFPHGDILTTAKEYRNANPDSAFLAMIDPKPEDTEGPLFPEAMPAAPQP